MVTIENKKNFFLNLKKYPKRTKKEIRLIDKNPWGDKDGDKVPNIFDCKPLDKNKQAWGKQVAWNKDTQEKLTVIPEDTTLDVKKSLNP